MHLMSGIQTRVTMDRLRLLVKDHHRCADFNQVRVKLNCIITYGFVSLKNGRSISSSKTVMA